jgi:hypothetical protein
VVGSDIAVAEPGEKNTFHVESHRRSLAPVAIDSTLRIDSLGERRESFNLLVAETWGVNLTARFGLP